MKPSTKAQTRSATSAPGEWSRVFRHSYSLPAEKAQPIQNVNKINAILKHIGISECMCRAVRPVPSTSTPHWIWIKIQLNVFQYGSLSRGAITITLVQQVEFGQLLWLLSQLRQQVWQRRLPCLCNDH